MAQAKLTELKKTVKTHEAAMQKAQAKRDSILQDLQAAEEKAREALDAHSDAMDTYIKHRTNSFDTKLVATARKLGVNPDNFETEKDLRKAVKVMDEPTEEQDDGFDSEEE